MTFCCDRFEFAYKQRHERGVFVYVLPPTSTFPDEPLFHVGTRALERDEVGKLQEATKGRMSGCMSLSGGTGISYCPWCGMALANYYRDTWRQLLDERITNELGFSAA